MPSAPRRPTLIAPTAALAVLLVVALGGLLMAFEGFTVAASWTMGAVAASMAWLAVILVIDVRMNREDGARPDTLFRSVMEGLEGPSMAATQPRPALLSERLRAPVLAVGGFSVPTDAWRLDPRNEDEDPSTIPAPPREAIPIRQYGDEEVLPIEVGRVDPRPTFQVRPAAREAVPIRALCGHCGHFYVLFVEPQRPAGTGCPSCASHLVLTGEVLHEPHVWTRCRLCGAYQPVARDVRLRSFGCATCGQHNAATDLPSARVPTRNAGVIH